MVDWASWGFVLFLKQQKNRTEVYTRGGLAVYQGDDDLCMCACVCLKKTMLSCLYICHVYISVVCVCVCVMNAGFIPFYLNPAHKLPCTLIFTLSSDLL